MTYLPADPLLTIRDLLRSARRPATADLTDRIPGRARFFGSGRAALWAALRALGVGPADEVLLPSYLCESVVSPVALVGARPSFYPIGRDLRPNLAALEAAIGPRTRAVVVIHYLGFPGPVDQLGDLCRWHGLVLIEDCAHALFSRHGQRLLGSFGAAAVFSPWKSLPLPDGGVLALNQPSLAFDEPIPRVSAIVTARRLVYRSLGTVEAAVGWSPRTTLLRRPGLRRDLHRRTSGAPVTVRAGSRIAYHLLRSAAAGRIITRRREHYRRLLDAARSLSWGRPIFDDLPDGVCPLGFPMLVEERNRVRDDLLAAGVNVRTYWDELPAQVDRSRFPDAAWLRNRILVLPVHQGLRFEQIDWLARRLATLDARKDYAALAHR